MLVTGAARRVGRSIALALAEAGAHIVVHYHSSAADAQATAHAIKSHGVDALPLQADQADPAQVTALFAAVRAHFGRLDGLINSASAFDPGDFLDLDLAHWQHTLDVNLTGPFLCSQAAARLMQDRDDPGGVIVNVLDHIGRQPWPTYAAHSVAKAGLTNLTHSLARALAPTIRVNGVAPGPVLKPDGLPAERWTAIGERLPLMRPGQPEDVGRTVVLLARDTFLTGAILAVDGGANLIGVPYTGSAGLSSTPA